MLPKSWDNDLPCQACGDHWGECLSEQEKSAASTLGFTQSTWNSGDGDGGGMLCFSKVATVQELQKGTISMEDLKVGDRILTGSSGYQTIYAFGHYKSDELAKFLQIHTTLPNKKPLEVTAEHLVFKENSWNPVRADSIKVGDLLLSGSGSGSVKSAAVTKIKHVERKGVFTPLTKDGTVVVDGIVASSYVSLQNDSNEYLELGRGFPALLSHHNYIHIALSPFRLFCTHFSGNFCSVRHDIGMPFYVSFGLKMNAWALKQGILVKASFFLVIILLTCLCHSLECILEFSLLPLVVLAFMTVYAMRKNKNTKGV